MNERPDRAEGRRDDPGRGRRRDRTGTRRLPIGAEPVPTGGVHFRIWAPNQAAVEVVLVSGPGAPDVVALSPEEDGYFAGLVP
jgi:maltooligosyltrehalose trehalohydrolase